MLYFYQTHPVHSRQFLTDRCIVLMKSHPLNSSVLQKHQHTILTHPSWRQDVGINVAAELLVICIFHRVES